jgi:hypothetical protein
MRWQVDKRGSSGIVWVYPILLLLSLGIFGYGVYLLVQKEMWSVALVGVSCTVVVMATWPLAAAMLRAANATEVGCDAVLTPLTERLEQFSVMLNMISEQQLLSDRAKAVAYRDKDRDALRRAIQEEMGKRDFESALLLTDRMEEDFGYRQEAMILRQQISERQNEAARKQIMDTASQINRLCSMEKWTEANREAERLIRLFPAIEQVRNLPSEIEARRQQTKKQLIDAFHDASGRRDLDGAYEILKKLDNYLTANEATGLQDEARLLIKQRMEHLRAQFGASVREQNWSEAYRIGEIIIRDYPNTQMAKEVREHEDALRQRASQPLEAVR